MPEVDPFRDLERRLDRLESRLDVRDVQVQSELKGIREDLKRIEASTPVTKEHFDEVVDVLEKDIEGMTPMNRFSPVERVVYGLVALGLVWLLNQIFGVIDTSQMPGAGG